MNLPAFTIKASMQLIATTISLSFFSACHKQDRRTNDITKIELATGDCFGPCQLTAVSIDSNLRYNYYGGEIPYPKQEPDTTKIYGYFKGNVSKAFWDTLNRKLNEIHYEQLDSAYQHSVDDQSLEVLIYYKGNTKHITAQSASLPDKVRQTFYWIAESYKKTKLSHVKDTITFHTRIQNPFHLPVDVKGVKFLPPVSIK
jgi:hypothetical protein